jgi:hypothetical protein
MFFKRIAAAIAGLCLVCGTAYAAPEAAVSPNETPEAVGATGDGVIILELGPMQGGPASAEEAAAMQLLLLQLLLMQSQMESGGGEMQMIAPKQSTGVGI